MYMYLNTLCYSPTRAKISGNVLPMTRRILVAGACGVLTWLVGDPGDVPSVPLRCPSGSRSGPLSGPLYNLQGDTQLLRDEFINVQSINPSINQANNLGYFSIYKLCL